jgi:hypothetical protein
MIVLGYNLLNTENEEITATIQGEYEILTEGQDAFLQMIEDLKDNENVKQFFWGIRLSPDEYQITAYRDNEV